MESLESSKTAQLKSLEGTIVTGRDLPAYERMLGFDRELLRGKTVLNFGPGMTHLEEALGEKGVTSTVVNLDITKEPLISTHDVVRFSATMTLDLYRKLLEKFGADTGKVQEMQRRFKGVKDKTFVQYDGRKIPFADGSFDHVFALWSTYQIPHGEREGVYRELMRVGKHIHIGPIGKVDFTMLLRLADTQGFDVVACESLYIRDMKRRIGLGVQMNTLEDYEAYMESKPASERIAVPLIDDLTFAIPGVDTRLLNPIQGGSTIILKKRSEHAMGEMMGNEVYVGVGKPDGLPVAESFDKAQGEAPIDKARGETHPAVGAVKRTLSAWWERVGPGGVEKQWVAAHKNILANIKETERFGAFEKTAEGWRKYGKALGFASTVVDFGMSGLGLLLTGTSIGLAIEYKGNHRSIRYLFLGGGIGAASAGVGLIGGPMHISTRLGAKVAEFFGVALANAENYVATGKAAQHAEAVGEVLDKGFKVIAKNPELVPEKYRKTVEILSEVSEKEEQARKAADLQRSIQEKENLQREYQEWKDTMDKGLESYYKLRGEWPPPKEEYLKVRSEVQKDIMKQNEMAAKAKSE